jgi:putative restriction endonuclease
VTNSLSPVQITRLEKVAVDNGFDQEILREPEWLCFASTQCPLRIWLGSIGNSFVVAFSQKNVAQALEQYGNPVVEPLPQSAVGGCAVIDVPSLHRLLRRAFQLSKTLPDELLHVFERNMATMPRATEVERVAIQRMGQEIFRRGLIEYWDGRCAITGLAVAALLRASHIKPWADCDTDGERLDVFNGFLLAPHIDAAFDLGFISVDHQGRVLVSAELDDKARETLGFHKALRVRELKEQHRRYLPWHRERVFRGQPS